MSLINVQNFTFSYDGGYRNIFENVSFRINTDWKLGFVGRNGKGKTTFLNALSGKLDSKGAITSNVAFTYFPFEVADKTRLSIEIMNEVCPAEDWEIIRELSALGMDAETLYRPFETLSDGERTKLLLAGLFLSDGFPLIDEPTNHLDAEGRNTVSAYLKKKRGFIIVSHDREFLDGCTDHILALNRNDIEVQSGNFSSWFENFTKRRISEEARNEKLQKDISRLRESARRTAVWADKTEASKKGAVDRGFVGHKAAKMMKRAKTVEARQYKAIEEKSALLKNAETSERLKLFPLPFHSEKLVACAQTSVVYGGKQAFAPVSFELLRGERIALAGRNGCGKSSLMKLIAGEKLDYTGKLTLPSGLIISYLPQTAQHLFGDLTEYSKEQGLDDSLFKAILSKLDLTKEHFGCDIANLSEGQKKKILIASSLCRKAHLYVWDEPLNYIDLFSRIQIENLIKEFKPSMLFAEHDGAFRREVATRIIEM